MKTRPAQPVPQCQLPITLSPHFMLITLQRSSASAWQSPLHCLACLARFVAKPDEAESKTTTSNN